MLIVITNHTTVDRTMDNTTIKLRLEENQRAVEGLQARADALLEIIRSKDTDQVPGAAYYGHDFIHEHLDAVRVAIIACIKYDLTEGHIWNGQGTQKNG